MNAPIKDPSRPTRARLIVAVVVTVLAVLVVVLASRPAADRNEAASPVVGQEAPPVQGQTLANTTVDTSTMRGRWLVVNFFATWCGPCREEHPELVRFSEKHAAPDAPKVVAVSFDKSDVASARSFFARNGGEWPVVIDETGGIAISYGVRGLPETYVIDPNGRVAARITGAVKADALDAITGTA